VRAGEELGPESGAAGAGGTDPGSAALADLRGLMAANPRLPYGCRPVVVLMLVALVDRVETSLVAGVLPLLQEEWGFGDTLVGAIPTAAAIAGIIVTLPAATGGTAPAPGWAVC
jgi:hypothetical protein